jgi:DNA-binding transcriptional MocR family regulator
MDMMPIRGTTAAQIANSVRDLIASGKLAPGAALPPVRALAAELGVNRNTVATAYRQLVSTGVTETHGRGGTVVAAVPRPVGEGAGLDGGLIDLAGGNPDPLLLPDLLAAARQGDYRQPLYGAVPVDPDLAAWAADHFAADVAGRTFRVLVTHGAVDATERLLNAYLSRDDAVAVEDPCFLASIGTLRVNGLRGVPVAVDQAGMRPESLRAALAGGVRAVVCTPRAHNPTGTSVTGERAAELRAVLAGYPQVPVIEDDHFSAVSAVPYRRVTPPSTVRWALVRSVSKFLGPDLRLALVAADEETAGRLERRLYAGTMWVSRLLQHTAYQLLVDPAVSELHARARTAYARRGRRLVAELRARSVAVPSAYRPDGLNVWIDLATGARTLVDARRAADTRRATDARTIVNARTVVDALARRGWAVRPGGLFAVGSHERQALRVTTATLTEEHARRFADDLAALLADPHRV